MKGHKKDHKTEIIIAIIGLVGIVLTAMFANWDKIFPKEPTLTNGVPVINSPSRTCKYTSGPKQGTIQYFSPEEYPIINPALVGQRCTDGFKSWGNAIQDIEGLK